MIVSVTGLVRTVLAAAAGAGLVYAASQAPGALALGPSANADTSTEGGSAPARSTALVCPGPELRGVEGLDDYPVDVTVAAAAAPERVLTGLSLPSTAGRLTLGRLAGGDPAATATARARVVATSQSRPEALVVRGAQSLAPGLAATQGWLVTSGDQRGLGLSACGRPSAESWLLAGGGEAGRQERLVLTNPGENPVTVDLTLHGIAGPVASPNGKGVVVPSRGRVTVLLDSIAGAERSPAVHVAAEGGLVHAALNDYWLDGSVAAGSDDTPAAAPPAREQVVAAVPVDGAGALRVVVPGDDEAVVQARALTPDGPRALAAGGVVRVPGGTVRDLRLDGLPKGTYGLQVRADVPVVAGAVVTRRAQAAAGDLAWSASTTPVRGVAGTPLPRGWIRAAGSASGAAGALGTRPEAVAEVPVASALTVTSTGGRASIEVVTTDATGAPTSRRLTLGADTATSLDLGDARSVWVHRLAGSGALRAGVVATATDAKGGLVSVLPLTDSVLRTTSVGVREVPE